MPKPVPGGLIIQAAKPEVQCRECRTLFFRGCRKRNSPPRNRSNDLDFQRGQNRRVPFYVQIGVDQQRKAFAAKIEVKLVQRALSTNLFVLKWHLL